MQPIELTDQAAPSSRGLPVHILLERRPADIGVWVDHVWDAVGVVVGQLSDQHDERKPVRQDDNGTSQYLVGGLSLQLYPDECESYYHNLMSPAPRCYIVAHLDETDSEEARPEPFLVSMSFDEAHAYLEGDDDIYAVEIPPEIYRWTEAFVLSFYAPEKRRKRKRTEWAEKPESTQ